MPCQTINVTDLYGDKQLKREHIAAFREWLTKQPHLPQVTELQLILFLHSCHYSLEAAKKTLDNFFTVRTLCPEMFITADEGTVREQLSVGLLARLPDKTPEGYNIFITKLIDTNPEHYDCVKQILLGDMIFMLNCYQNGPSEGVVSVFDMKGFSFGHMTRLNLAATKKHLQHVQEGAPIRIKGLHFINIVPFTDKLIAMVKPFMKKELIEMINFHNDMESLYKHIPKKCLPLEYGGSAPSLDTLQEENIKNMINNLEVLKLQDSQLVDETKRPGKPKNSGSVFGMDGSFKKLEVD